LGKSQFDDPLFNGAIDEFKIYSRALSAQEINSQQSTLKTAFNKIDESTEKDIIIKNTVFFPNPALDKRFTISTASALIGAEVQVKLINLAGETIYLKSVKNDTGTIDIVLNQNLSDTVYILFLNNQYSGKVIIKK
jgi:hypothetical protein